VFANSLTGSGRVGARGARRVAVDATVGVVAGGSAAGGSGSAGRRNGDAGGTGERPQLLRGDELRASVRAAVGEHCTARAREMEARRTLS
jgi:hypothetical protein